MAIGTRAVSKTADALEKFLEAITWTESAHRISAWTEKGISHGFEGKGFDLPSSGYALQQVHSPRLVHLPAKPLALEPGDGLISTHKGQVIAVKTADCLPILIAHPRGVLALHAGWKGLAADILGGALQWMDEQGWALEEAEFALGPCISLDSFEVGPELLANFRREAFALQTLELAFASSKGQSDRWHLDLAVLAALQLARFAIEPARIHVVRTCTKKRADLWHSYRRDGTQAGRNWSWITA